MLNKEIIKKRLELLLHDVVEQNSGINFKIHDLHETEEAFIIELVPFHASSITVAYLFTNDTWAVSVYGDDPKIQHGKYFDDLIRVLTHEYIYFDQLWSLSYMYDSNFFIYNGTNRWPAFTKDDIANIIDAFKQSNEEHSKDSSKKYKNIIIVNNNTGQKIYLELD